MTFRLPFQIPRAVFHLRQARSPERLAKNFCQLDGLKLNIPTSNGEQITNIHHTNLLDDCKKCFKLSVQEQLSHLSFNKKNKPFSARSKYRKGYKNQKDAKLLKQENNGADLPFCKINGNSLNKDKLLTPKSIVLNQRANYNSLRKEPSTYELLKIQKKQRKKFKCEPGYEEEEEQKLFFRDGKQNMDECYPHKTPPPNIKPKLKRLSKSYDDEQMIYCHSKPRTPYRCERADDIYGYKIKPKKLSNLKLDECVQCDRMDRLVANAPKIKPLKKTYDDTKLPYKHQCYYEPPLPKRADDLVGYKVTPKKLSKLDFPNDDCIPCIAQNKKVTYMPKLKSPEKYYDDTKLPYPHKNPVDLSAERADDTFGFKVVPKKLKLNPGNCERCDQRITVIQDVPRLKPPKKIYDDSKLPYHEDCEEKFHVVERSDDLAGYKVKQKVLPEMKTVNECLRCYPKHLLVSEIPKLKRLRKVYDDKKLPFQHSQTIIPHWCESVERSDDISGYKIERKKLSKLPLQNDCTKCYTKDFLVETMPKLKRLKKSFDDKLMPYPHEEVIHPHWTENQPRCDEINGYTILPKKLKKLKAVWDDCVPCHRHPKVAGMTTPKLKRLKPKKYLEKNPCCTPVAICNIDPPRMDDVLCYRPKKRKLPSFRTAHTYYSTYTSGLPPERGSILHITSKKLPSFNTSHKYSTCAKNYVLSKPFIDNLFKVDFDPAIGSRMENITLQTRMADLSPYILEYQKGINENLKSIKPPATTWGYVDPVENKLDKEINIPNIEHCTPCCTMQSEVKESGIEEIVSPLAGWGFISTPKNNEIKNFTTEENDFTTYLLRRTYSTHVKGCPHDYSPPCCKTEAPYFSYGDYKCSVIKDPTECPDLMSRLLQPSYQFNDPIHVVQPPPPAWGHVDPSIEAKCKVKYRSNGPLYDGPWAEQEAFFNICARYYEKRCPPRAPESCCTARSKIECENKPVPPYPSFSDMKPQFPDVEQNECWYARMMARKQKVVLNLEKARRYFNEWFCRKTCCSCPLPKKPVRVCSSPCYPPKKTKRNRYKKFRYKCGNEQSQKCKASCTYVGEEKRDSSPPTYNCNFLANKCYRRFSFKNIHTRMPCYRPEKTKKYLKCKPPSKGKSCEKRRKSSREEIKSKILQGYFKCKQQCKEKCDDFLNIPNKMEAFNKMLGCTDSKCTIKKSRKSQTSIESIAAVKEVLSKYHKKVHKKCKELSDRKSAIKNCCSKAKAVSISKKASKKFNSKPCCPERKNPKRYIKKKIQKDAKEKQLVAHKGKPSRVVLLKGKPTQKLCKKKSDKLKKQSVCPTCLPKPRPSLLQKVIAYFRARPNCPAPDDWKKQKMKEKAMKAARAAGLEVCEKSQKYCGRVKKRNGLSHTRKKFSTYSATNFAEKYTPTRNYSMYPYIHARKRKLMSNNEDKHLPSKYSTDAIIPCNKRNFSTIVSCPSRENLLLSKYSEVSINSYGSKCQQNIVNSVKYPNLIPTRSLATYFNKETSTPLPIAAKNIPLEALSNQNTFVGRMYQVKLSKIGVKNGLIRRNVDDEPYTFCQICKFVPRTSTVMLNKKEKRKCN